jgi:hypothetical protein
MRQHISHLDLMPIMDVGSVGECETVCIQVDARNMSAELFERTQI